MTAKHKNTTLIVLAFFSVYVIWGSTYLLNKIAVAELPPFMLASIRFMSAGGLVLTIAKLLGKKLSISWKELKNCIIAGALFLTFGNGIVVWALKYVDSGFAALEISAQPLMVLLLMRFIDGVKIRPSSMIGVVLGVIGIFLLVSQKELIAEEGAVIGMAMIFFCMLCWAYGSLFVAKATLPSNFFINTGYQMLAGGGLLFLGSIALGEEWSSPAKWSGTTVFSMALLIVLGSVVAFTAFNYLLKKVSPDKVATSTYVNPIVALLLGWYFLDEQITGQSLVAAAVLLSGVYFINTRRKIMLFSRFKSERPPEEIE